MQKKTWFLIFIAVMIMAIALPFAAQAGEGEEAVISIGERTFSTLQDALAQAQPNDTISISEGVVNATANEQFRITTNGLTIQGAGAATVINAGSYSVSAQAGVLVAADGVTIKNLTILSTAASGNVSALKFSKIGTETELPMVTNGKISNVTLSSTNGHALNIHGVTEMDIQGLNITGAGKCGISMASAPKVSIANSTIENAAWADIGMMYKQSAAYEVASRLNVGAGNRFGSSTNIYSERPASANGGADELYDLSSNGITMTPDMSTGKWVATTTSSSAVVQNTTTGLLFTSIEEALYAVEAKQTIKLLNHIELEKMLKVSAKQDITLDLGGKTITASELFSGSDENEKNLVQVLNSSRIRIVNGKLKATENNKNTLNAHASIGIILEDITLDHEAAGIEGAPLSIDGSTMRILGDFTVISGENTQYGIYVDNKNGEASLTFEQGSLLNFEDKSGSDLPLIYAQDTNADGSVPPPTITSNSDEIKFDQKEDGTYLPHVHEAAQQRQNVKEATCTQQGYSGDIVCAGCGEILEKGEVIPKLAHQYQDGKCSVCGETQASDAPEDSGQSGQDGETIPDTDNSDKDGNVPQTGDKSNVALWIFFMLAAGIALGSMAVYGKKKYNN